MAHLRNCSGKLILAAAEGFKANAVLGSILATGILAMALAGLYSAGHPDGATEFSSVTASK
jgi:hypothetical protein